MSKKTILLVCGTGMSTTILVKKMQKIVAEEQLDYEIIAANIGDSEGIINNENIDVLLLGPQVSYMNEVLSKRYAPKKVMVGSISKDDYGLANGRKVLELAESLLD